MGYASLADCVADLQRNGQLRRVDAALDPRLEIPAIQRRVQAAGGPAVLFTRPRGTPFPMLANLFGTLERARWLFRDSWRQTQDLLAAAARAGGPLRRPLSALALGARLLPAVLNMRPRRIPAARAPVLEQSCSLEALPHLVCWPADGGPFITLPLVYSEDPGGPGQSAPPGVSANRGPGNLGMYRVQLAGNAYAPDEVGLHYQIHRHIAAHHAHALEQGKRLPVHVFVGGPPALILAAVMPLPENISELRFAGLLGGRRTRLAPGPDLPLPLLADADFCLSGWLGPEVRPEGPFGDHLGYYSLRHDFPVLRVEAVRHRRGAIWPFTTVGRPPQEDTVLGRLIHELTGPLVPRVFAGVSEVHAVDASGVHPLLLALGRERYVPWERPRRPRELVTQALHLLGESQTALAKYVLIAAAEDAPGLSCRDVPAFLRHVLERTDFGGDLHCLTRAPADTLDYTGLALNEGSKLIWAVAGEKRRELGLELSGLPGLPAGFGPARLAAPGVLCLRGPRADAPRGVPDPAVANLAQSLAAWPEKEAFPLLCVVDDPAFCAQRLENFLWVAFTRSDPSTDIYGARARFQGKHWACEAPLVLDARAKPHHAPVLEEDPGISARVQSLAVSGGPLHGLF